MNEQRFPGDGGPQPSKGLGAFYGVLATIASFIVGSFVGVVLLVVVTSVIKGAGSSDSMRRAQSTARMRAWRGEGGVSARTR